MKKCLHLKKTKPHWRRKPPKVITWQERRELEKQREHQRRNFVQHTNLLFSLAKKRGLLFGFEDAVSAKLK